MVRFRDADRHQSTKRGFHSLRDARRFASSVETKVVSGDYIRPSAGKMTVGELTVEYLSGRSHLKPKSRESLRSLLDSRVLPRSVSSAFRPRKPRPARKAARSASRS